ncbi:MAG: ATP-dependent zinc metalloprotease FtsH [Spirochaetales bacterium]|nr:ATP-dependent zinc metalloprotease FtsH [Spirochaetales bacterium]
MNRQNNDNNNPQNQRGGIGSRLTLYIIIGIAVFIFVFIITQDNTFNLVETNYSQFLTDLEKTESAERITSVEFFHNREIIYKKQDGTTYKTIIPIADEELMKELRQKEISFTGKPPSLGFMEILINILPWILMIGIFIFMFRQLQGSGNRALSFGKSRAKRYFEGNERITFNDVAGQEEAKYELEEVVQFLKNPQKFTKIGAKIPKGVLLVGMPGTGKTLLAKAIAGEANVPFFHMSGSDFVEMFVGVGASRVRDLFEQGRKSAPCILFIDELDAVGRTRGAGYGGGHDEREQTLNQLLVEMDGFDTKVGVIIVAATNRPDVLDPALLRPGRFDRQVVVDMPDVKEREDIIKIHCKKISIATDIDFNKVARATPGTSGADLSNLVNEAALFAARKNKQKVEMEDFEEARDKVLMGVARKSKVIPPKEKEMVAFHEAGHALLHYFLKNADPLHKVTVIPHGRALGVAISLPEQDNYSKNKGWLLDRIVIGMGGYAAEKIRYKENTTGAQQDIEQGTNIARRMVCEWGMSDAMGPIAYGQKEEPIFIGKEIARHKDYSEETAKKIDKEIKDIVQTCLGQAMKILTDNKGKLKLLAETLVTVETLNDDEIRKLLNIPKKVDEIEQPKKAVSRQKKTVVKK